VWPALSDKPMKCPQCNQQFSLWNITGGRTKCAHCSSIIRAKNVGAVLGTLVGIWGLLLTPLVIACFDNLLMVILIEVVTGPLFVAIFAPHFVEVEVGHNGT